MISSKPEVRSQTDPRIKEAARRCAEKIKASTEAHEEAIAQAYKTYQREVAEIEGVSRD
jgi:hypothetical protein